MVATPPDAVGPAKPIRQSDTSESSDDDQPSAAKKMKLDDTKGGCRLETFTNLNPHSRFDPFVRTLCVMSFRYTREGRGREGRKEDH